MKRVGDLSPMLEALNRKRLQRRAERLEKYGWSEDVTCSECGDTGVLPDPTHATGKWCQACEKGQTHIGQATRERSYLERTPRRFRDYSLDSHPNAVAVQGARDWIASAEVVTEPGAHGDVEVRHPRKNLLILGPVGSGKTGLAYGILRELEVVHNTRGYAGNVVDILDSLRPRDKDAASVADPVTVGRLVRVPVLLLDDIAAEKPSDFTQDRMYAIVNGRYQQDRGTIFTTNATRADIERVYGSRVLSRMTERVQVIQLEGRDLRRSKA